MRLSLGSFEPSFNLSTKIGRDYQCSYTPNEKISRLKAFKIIYFGNVD